MKTATALPTQIGQYQVTALLGTGGMGKVYKAHRFNGAQYVAIKELDLSKIDPLVHQETIDMFKREAKILKSAKDSSFFPEYFDFFEENNKYYLVMEYIDGQTLSDLVKDKGPLSEAEVKQIGLSVLEALSYLHAHNFIYRDVKPNNIMLTKLGYIKIVDFGITRPKQEKGQTLIGTLGYAPPEQFGGKADERSDFFALGNTLYYLLTNEDIESKPFSLDPIKKVLPSVSREMEKVVTKATRLEREDRFQNTQDMRKALLAIKAKPTNLQSLVNSTTAATPAAITRPTGRLVKCGGWHWWISPAFCFIASCALVWIGRGMTYLGLVAYLLLFVILLAVSIFFILGRCPFCWSIKAYYAVGKKLRGMGQFLNKAIAKIKQTLKRLWAGIKWGTWEDAKNFLFTPWPMVTFVATWFILWTIGRLIFYTEMMDWFWIVYLGLLWPAVIIAIRAFNQSEILWALPFFIISFVVAISPIIYSSLRPPANSFTITSQPIVAGKPSEILWRCNRGDGKNTKFYLIFPENRFRVALPVNIGSASDGKLTITFRQKTTMRFLAVDRARRETYEQSFVIEPMNGKKSVFKTNNLKIEL